jgi:hypothetical protein
VAELAEQRIIAGGPALEEIAAIPNRWTQCRSSLSNSSDYLTEASVTKPYMEILS